jgi:hypothetical protein
MKLKRFTALIGLIGCAAAATVWWPGSSRTPEPRTREGGNRILEFRRLVAEEEGRPAKVVADYTPSTLGRIDDLSVPATDLMRQLPGVVEIESPPPVNMPTHRLIHLRDWHFVPKDLYALDLKAAYKRHLSDREIDLLHEELLLEVELVQIEQMALLRCLIKHHGLRRVVSEGLAEGELHAYKEKIAAHRGVENEKIPALRMQLAEVRALLARTKEAEDRYAKAQKIEVEILTLLDQHRVALLELGAAGRLLMSGELEEVLPLEDAEKLEQAKPVTPSGEVKVDPAKVEVRRDAQVQIALKHGQRALVILGGSHDLSASVDRVTGSCEYIRVTTNRFKETGEQETKVRDMAMVCANCHRMIHRKRPWLPLAELVTILAQSGG